MPPPPVFFVYVADTSASQLFAFERDRKRFMTLQSMLSKAGCKNTETLNVDFTSIEPTDHNYSRVTHMYFFFHPSHSSEVQPVIVCPAFLTLHAAVPASSIGSTIFLIPVRSSQEAKLFATHNLRRGRDGLGSSRTPSQALCLSAHDDQACHEVSVQFLSFVRTNCLNSFLTLVPSVQKIVYSTCSVYAAENEHVVHQALNSEEAALGHFVLAPRSQVLPSWHRRGLPSDMKSDNPGMSCLS